MTNEEAFEKWAIDYGLDYEPSFTRYDVEAAWQAAISYMQEQDNLAVQSEPLIWSLAEYQSNKKWFDANCVLVEKNLITTPQRQQPLKRLDAGRIGFIFRKEMTLFEFYNALMDATEELNHD